MGVRNRSFRIEDDPMGDNFRQSLEDIRVGFRETVPKVNLTKNTENRYGIVEAQLS